MTARTGGSALWRLSMATPSHNVPLGPVATEAVEVARSVIARDVAALARPERLQAGGRWCAELLGRFGSGQDETIEGRSLGVAAAIAHVSLLSDEPGPTDVLASATLDGEGRVGAVEGLRAKLEVIRDWAPGVRRFLVAEPQVSEAKRLASAVGLPDLELIPVSHIDEVVSHAFPTLFADLRTRWQANPSEADRAARGLFELALGNTHLLQDWEGFALTARAVASAARDPEARRLGDLAATIAERHIGRAKPIALGEDWWRERRRPVRMRLLAHSVQAAADAVEDDWRAVADQARAELLEPLDQSRGDFMLLGALGRAHAAWHDWDTAAADLRAAIDGWFEIGEHAAASFPACELVRVLSDTGRKDELEQLLGDQVRRLRNEPKLDVGSQGFLTVAIVRALVQTGQAERALDEYEGFAQRLAATRWHVQGSMARWRALALDRVGEEAAAEKARVRATEIAAQGAASSGFVAALVRLDRGLRDGAANECEAALEQLCVVPRGAKDIARIEKAVGVASPLPEAIARFWRY
ncbi:MAG: hypothetical protein JJ863_38510 [Deltaproteobacteria bacterium]|nr:hypothetical protein [Deltaproteobacteria bacterium]